MKQARTTLFDAAAYLNSPEDAEAFLADAFQHGDEAEVVHALRIVGRSPVVAQGAPTNVVEAAVPMSFVDALGILKAAGLRLTIAPSRSVIQA